MISARDRDAPRPQLRVTAIGLPQLLRRSARVLSGRAACSFIDVAHAMHVISHLECARGARADAHV